jgi:KDO2-lipid IV(A) lauroyltransferase
MSLFGDLKQWFYYYPLRAALRGLPVACLEPAGRVLAFVEYYSTKPATRRRLEANVARALELDARAAKRKAKEIVKHYCYDVLEFIHYPRLRRMYGGQYLQFEGREILDAAMAKGKGVVMLSCHLAFFELYGAGPAMLGHRTGYVEPEATRPGARMGRIQRAIHAFRRRQQEEHFHFESIFTGVRLRSAVRAAEEGLCIAVAVDVAPNKSARMGTFLKFRRRIPEGAAFIAVRCGAEVVGLRLERLRFGRNRMTFEHIPIPAASDRREQVAALAAKLASICEGYIYRRPEQWAWRLWQEIEDEPPPS